MRIFDPLSSSVMSIGQAEFGLWSTSLLSQKNSIDSGKTTNV